MSRLRKRERRRLDDVGEHIAPIDSVKQEEIINSLTNEFKSSYTTNRFAILMIILVQIIVTNVILSILKKHPSEEIALLRNLSTLKIVLLGSNTLSIFNLYRSQCKSGQKVFFLLNTSNLLLCSIMVYHFLSFVGFSWTKASAIIDVKSRGYSNLMFALILLLPNFNFVASLYLEKMRIDLGRELLNLKDYKYEFKEV